MRAGEEVWKQGGECVLRPTHSRTWLNIKLSSFLCKDGDFGPLSSPAAAYRRHLRAPATHTAVKSAFAIPHPPFAIRHPQFLTAVSVKERVCACVLAQLFPLGGKVSATCKLKSAARAKTKAIECPTPTTTTSATGGKTTTTTSIIATTARTTSNENVWEICRHICARVWASEIKIPACLMNSPARPPSLSHDNRYACVCQCVCVCVADFGMTTKATTTLAATTKTMAC